MQRIVQTSAFQKLTNGDIDNIGIFARATMDDTLRDAATDENKFAGFNVVQAAPASVTVGAGRFYKNGEAYFRADVGGVTVDMVTAVPAVAKKIATIVAWGQAIETNSQTREFLTDPVTRAKEARSTDMESRRHAEVGVLYGTENATPQPPAVPADYVAIASIVLTPAGIETITMLVGNQMPSLKKQGQAIDTINAELNAIRPELSTAKTNIAGLGEQLRGKAPLRTVIDLAYDVGSIKDRLGLPDNYISWDANHLLDDTKLDPAFSGYAAYINDGAHYPHAASAELTLALLNAQDPAVVVHNNMVMPKFESVARLSVLGKDGEYSLADTTIETTDLRNLSTSRTVREYIGSAITVSYEGKADFTYDAEKNIFIRGGETFEGSWVKTGDLRVAIGTLRKFVDKTITEPYFDRVTTTTSVSGAILAQNLLQGGDGLLTAVNLLFTRKALAGDVRVVVCETKAGGEPDLDRVLGQSVLANANIIADLNGKTKTRVAFAPIVLLKGRRYAIALISNAAHFLAYTKGNKLASGALFYSLNGAWVQKPADEDLAIELEFAEFSSNIVPVQLSNLTLAGGIDRIRINADYTTFDGCRLEFQYMVAGGTWKTMSEDETLLAARPDLLQQRVVFIGTKDVMPMLGLGAGRSVVLVSKPDDDRVIISDPETLPSASDEIRLRVRYDNWDATYNSSTVTVLTGGSYTTVETADLTTTAVPDDDPDAIIREYTFNLAGAVTSFRYKLEGHTSDTHFCDVVRKVEYVALP